MRVVTQLVVDTEDFYWKTYMKNTDVQLMTRHIPFDQLPDIKRAMGIGFSEEELPYLKDRLHTLIGDMANGDCDTITVIYRAFDKREIKDADDVDRIIKMAQEHEDNPILEIQVKGINEEELEYTLHIRPDKVETLTTKNPCS